MNITMNHKKKLPLKKQQGAFWIYKEIVGITLFDAEIRITSGCINKVVANKNSFEGINFIMMKH